MSNEKIMFNFSPGQAQLKVGTDFAVGYHSGYQLSQPASKLVLTEQDISNFLAKHLCDANESDTHNAGYITGYIASLTEIVAGDCLMERPASFGQEWQEDDTEQRETVRIALAKLPLASLASLPDFLFYTLFLSQARKDALTLPKWDVLTAHLRNVWLAQQELAECGKTARTIEACLLSDFMLKELVYGYADTVKRASGQDVDWDALTWEQCRMTRQEHYQQAKTQALEHPAAQELVRRGIRLYDWDETE